MHINYTGDFTVKNTRQQVYDFLTDPERFCPLLPDFKGMTKEDEEHFTVVLSLGISHIRGDARIKMVLAEAVAPARAAYSGRGDILGTTVNIAAAFDLADTPEGTRVNWSGDVQIFGRLVSVAGGLLEPLGRKNLQKLIDGLQAALANDKEAVRA